MRNIYIQILCLVFMIFVSSCESLLDKSPDSRTEIDSPEKITKLLIDGYCSHNYGVLAELSGDNFIDNNSYGPSGEHYNLSSLERFHDEAFAWEPAFSSQDTDSPSAVWSGCYHAIAVANQALQVIAKFEAEGRGNEVKAQKGEALLIRAYYHFVLTNVFCQTYRSDLLSKNDSGVPYSKIPQTKVIVNYSRSNVTDTYKKIEADLLEGLPLIDDANYKVPKYHFNKQAAYAFATRFYLYKRNYPKVIEYANKALGNNAVALMRDWNADLPTYTAFADGWINAQSANNFMLVSTYSLFNRIFGTRYGCNREAAFGTVLGVGPTWLDTQYGYHPCYYGRLYIGGDSQEYGVYFPKAAEYFEYTDKIAGIGYTHVIRAEFTAEETLLCRAEAYTYLDQINLAIADLKTFDDSRKIEGHAFGNLDEASIRNFYKPSNTLFVKNYHTTQVSPDFVLSTNNKPIIDCILHFRRLETIYDGYRWFDIKRYGIEITHKIGLTRTETLAWDDLRRAIQIPGEVIAAGLSPNIRPVPVNTTPKVKYVQP